MTGPRLYYRSAERSFVAEFDRDPFEVLDFVRKRMFPHVQVPAVDLVFEQIMQERAKRRQKSKAAHAKPSRS